MKIGDKVKTEIIEGVWFAGVYSDNFPDSDSILIQGRKWH
jgi:hypothetical protein